MRHAIFRFINANRGATAIEYGVIAAGVALAIAGAVAVMGDNLSGNFGWLSEQLDSTVPGNTDGTNSDDNTSSQPEPQTINRDRGNVVVIPSR